MKEIPEYHTKWSIREEKYQKIILTDKLEFHILELGKLEKYKNKSEKEIDLLLWCKFLVNPEKVEVTNMTETERMIEKARQELYKISQDGTERKKAEAREKALRDEMAIRASGLKDGIIEGKLEVAKKMLSKKMKIEDIAELTEFSLDEIRKIASEKDNI